jgi:hypothetical protein
LRSRRTSGRPRCRRRLLGSPSRPRSRLAYGAAERQTDVLPALVGMVDQPGVRAPARERPLQGVDHEARAHVGRHRPAGDQPGCVSSTAARHSQTSPDVVLEPQLRDCAEEAQAPVVAPRHSDRVVRAPACVRHRNDPGKEARPSAPRVRLLLR